MKRILQIILSASALVGAAYAQPTITSGGVLNAASYALPGLPNAAIAQGSIFAVFGSGMGPAALQSSALPLSSTLAGTSLTVTVNGTATKPFLIYTSAGQLAAVMPSNTPAGTGTITVTYNGATSGSVPLQVTTASPGIFAVNSAGSGPGIITNVGFSVTGLTTAANPGEAFIIWGTGTGPVVSGDESRGTGTVGTVSVKVFVGGMNATVIGAARAPQLPGLDQVAFFVPTGVTGCHVPVAVQIGNVISNYVSMPVATTGRICSDPANTNVSQLLNQPAISIGSVALARSAISLALPAPLGTTVTTSDVGTASFYKYTPAQYSATQNPLDINTFGACTVFTFKGSSAGYVDPVLPINLDAGPSLTVNGPGGAKTLVKSNGSYFATLGGGGIAGVPGSGGTPLYLTPGSYSINNGSGGADVGPFTTTLNVPNPLVWTNAAATSTVVRANGQNVTWTGGDPAGDVYIIGFATTGATNATVGAEFVCVEKASKGSFFIPAPVLLSLPASSASALIPTGFMGVEFSTASTFTARGLDQGVVSASGQTLQTVTFQ